MKNLQTKFRLENNKSNEFNTTIISAKTINCENVIDKEFSETYFENLKDIEG